MICPKNPAESASFRFFNPLSRVDYLHIHDMLLTDSIVQWMEGTGDITPEEYQRWVTTEEKVSYLFAALDKKNVLGFVYYYQQEDDVERVDRLLQRNSIRNHQDNTNYLELSFAKKNLDTTDTTPGIISSCVRQTALYLRNLYHTQYHQKLNIVAFIDPENTQSRRLVENNGFEIIDSLEYREGNESKDIVYQLNWQTLEKIVEQRLTNFYYTYAHNPIDNRRFTSSLIESFQILKTQYNWQRKLICYQGPYPIYAFISPHPSPKYLWVLGGVHGEEPASGEAFVNKIDFIGALGQETPIVFLPLLNPLARQIDWRYENEYRDFNKGTSITMCTHLLVKNTPVPNGTGKYITDWIMRKNLKYPPLLVLDHHEDRICTDYAEDDPKNITSCYVYVSGKGASTMPIAAEIISIFMACGLPVVHTGQTRFSEPIHNGIIINTSDNSVDDFLSKNFYINPTTQETFLKPAADTVLVIETTVPFKNPIPLDKRVLAHEQIIQKYPHFWTQSLSTHQE